MYCYSIFLYVKLISFFVYKGRSYKLIAAHLLYSFMTYNVLYCFRIKDNFTTYNVANVLCNNITIRTRIKFYVSESTKISNLWCLKICVKNYIDYFYYKMFFL